MTDLDYDQFDAVFERFAMSRTSTSAFRWESLQTYSVSLDDPGLQAFRTGAPRPERSVRTSPWLARIARSTIIDGKRWRRVRYIEQPLTEFTQYELLSYVEAQAAGDETMLTTVELARSVPDFWLFSGDAPDDRAAIVMHYTPEGEALRFEWTNDSGRLSRLHAAASEATAHAVSLNEFLARHAVAGAR